MLWVPLIVGVAIVLVTLQGRFRGENPEWAVLLSVTFCVVVMIALLPRIGDLVGLISGLASEAGVGSMYLAPVLKTIATAYVASFGAQISRDAGEDSIAAVVELAGKVVIMLVALPVVKAILHALFSILG